MTDEPHTDQGVPICTCGGNVVHATTSMTGAHAGNCPVGLSILAEWQRQRAASDERLVSSGSRN